MVKREMRQARVALHFGQARSNMESSKKRQLTETEDHMSQKKRALSGSNGTPEAYGLSSNEATEDEELANEKLENFRKEAIFRKMKHYSRENARSQAQLADLEKRRSTCEAGLIAMAACWEQVVSAIRTLIKTDDLPTVDENAQSLFDLSELISVDDDPALKVALDKTMHDSRALITQFIQSKAPFIHEDSFKKHQAVQNECIVLRSQALLAGNTLRQTQALCEKYHQDLMQAQNHVERLKSTTVLATQPRGHVQQNQENAKPVKAEEEKAEENSNSKPELINSPQVEANITSLMLERDNALKQIEMFKAWIAAAEAKNKEYESERKTLLEQVDAANLANAIPSEETIKGSVPYKLLLDASSHAFHQLEQMQEEVPRLRKEVTELQSTRQSREDALLRERSQAELELKTVINKRDQDNARLRDQREQIKAELLERKAKDSVTLNSIAELKDLAKSRSDRINTLQSEIKRYKTLLAAKSGDKELLQFILRDEDMPYVDDLKSRLATAEARVAALEQTLAAMEDATDKVLPYATALQQLQAVQSRLDHYTAVYGDSSSLPPDAKSLADQLEMKETELKRLQLVETQYADNEIAMMSELDNLTNAWEQLDARVGNKVFDLAEVEDKLTKLTSERARMENKYFAVMRERDTGAHERKLLHVQLESDKKVIQGHEDRKRTFEMSLSKFTASMAEAEQKRKELLDSLDNLEKEKQVLQISMEGETKKIAELEQLLNLARERTEKDLASIRHHESASGGLKYKLIQMQKDLAAALAAPSTNGTHSISSSGPAGETREQRISRETGENAVKLLKCNACNGQNFKSRLLTKCLHTFCESCITSRIQTRQRKCPMCSLPFGTSDVATLFFN